MSSYIPSSQKRFGKSGYLSKSFLSIFFYEVSHNKLLQFIIGMILILLAGKI